MQDKLKTFAIPVVTGVVSLGLLGSGIGLAATESQAALIPVVSSNLSMVLALAGAAVLVTSIMSWDYVAFQYPGKPHETSRYLCIAAAIIAALATGICYAGVHMGIGSVLPATLSVVESMAVQGAIGFGICGILGAAFASVFSAKPTSNHALQIGSFTLLAGLIGAAITITPALSMVMGAAAASAPEAIAMEVMVSFGAACLFYLALKASHGIEGASQSKAKIE